MTENKRNIPASYNIIPKLLIKYRDAFLRDENIRRQALGKRPRQEYLDATQREHT